MRINRRDQLHSENLLVEPRIADGLRQPHELLRLSGKAYAEIATPGSARFVADTTIFGQLSQS